MRQANAAAFKSASLRPEGKGQVGGGEPAHRTELIRIGSVIGVALLVGIVRLANLGYASLPHDEAFRANWWYGTDLNQMRRFPPLQWALGWVTQHAFGQTEYNLRFPYAVAGIACILLLYWVVRHRLGAPAALWVALIGAGHPVLVEASRQAKVFSLESLIVPALIVIAVRACKQPTGGRIISFLALGILGFGFTFTASLATAACLPFVIWAWARADEDERAGRFVMVSTVVLLLVTGAFWYWWLSDFTTRNICVSYYATEEIVWPAGYEAGTLALWAMDACYGALQYVLGMSHTWPPISWCIGTLMLLGILGSMPVLWRSFRLHLILVVIVIIGAIFAGALKQWPFGNIRHTTFLIPFAVFAAGVGMWELTRQRVRTPAAMMLVLFCIGLPYARAVKASIVYPPTPEHVRPLFDYVEKHAVKGDALFIYYPVDEAFWYYWRDENMPALVQPREDRGRPDVFAARFKEWMSLHGRMWFVIAHDWGGEKKAWTEYLQATYDLLDAFEVGDSAVYLFGKPHHAVSVSGISEADNLNRDR